MYYLCSENKGADQLRGYREADLRLCFRICKKPVFSRRGSYTPYLAYCFQLWTLAILQLSESNQSFMLQFANTISQCVIVISLLICQ